MPVKLTIQFNDRQKEALDKMADDLGTTKAGVLKAALSLLQVVRREKRAGNQIGVIKNDKVVKEIVGIEWEGRHDL